MYLMRLKSFTFLFGLIFLLGLALTTGCGGGSQSVGVSQVDTVGISSTLNGFFQSLRGGDPQSFFSPALKAQTGCSESICTLKIWDFGSDINDANDNYAHYFTVPHDGINQLTDDYAKAYAVKDFSGRAFRVDFELVKIDGQWFIETIQFSGDATDFVNASALLPLQRGNSWKSIAIPANHSGSISSPVMVIGSIPDDPVSLDSRSVYEMEFSSQSTSYYFNLSNYSDTLTALKTTDSWHKLQEAYYSSNPSAATSIRGAFIDIFTQPQGDHRVGYASDQGLYIYGTSNFNSGEAVKYLSAAPTIGEIATQTVTVQWADGNTYQVFLASRLARKISIQTFAGPFDAYQVDAYVRFLNSVPSGQTQEMFASNLYQSNVGLVAQVEWDGNGAATYIHLLYSALVNNTMVAPLDDGTTPAPAAFAFEALPTLSSAQVEQDYQTVLVSGGQEPYTYRLLSGDLPAGLNISAGTLYGQPSEAGTVEFTIEFTDYAGHTISQAFSITIAPSNANLPTFVAVSPLPLAAIGSTYDQVLVTGGVTPYTFSLADGLSLPTGLVFSQNGISGTPDNLNSPGLYTFTVVVTDYNSANITREFQLAIGPELTIGATDLLPGTVSKQYDMPLAVIGGIAPLSISLQSGSTLPANLTLDQTDLKITGIPETAGNYSFTIVAADATGKTVNKTFSMEVVGNLTTNDLGTLDPVPFQAQYSQQLITGGKAPYTYIFSQSLPGGLTLGSDGYITGSTDSALGDYVVVVSVYDSIGNSITNLTFTLEVVDKYAVAPNFKWQKVYGSTSGAADYYETAEKIIPTSDGGLLVAGIVAGGDGTVTGTYEGSSSTNPDVWLVKIDGNGQITWQSVFGGNGYEKVGGVAEDDSGNFIVVGSTNSTSGTITTSHGSSYDLFILSVSAGGTMNWVQSYGGTNTDDGFEVEKVVFPSPSIVVTGQTFSNDGDLSDTNMHYNGSYSDMWVLRIDPANNGSILWQQAFGGNYNDSGRSIGVHPSGSHLFVAGSSASADGDRLAVDALGSDDVWIVKLDTSSDVNFGNLLGQYSFGGSGIDIAHACKIMDDGSLIVTGETRSSGVSGYRGSVDVYVLKMNSTGTAAFQRALGCTSYVDIGHDIQFVPNGSGNYNIVVAGTCAGADGDVQSYYGNEDAWLLSLDNTGAVLNWEKTYGGGASEAFRSICYWNGSLVTVGNTSSTDYDLDTLRTDYGSYDWWLAQFE